MKTNTHDESPKVYTRLHDARRDFPEIEDLCRAAGSRFTRDAIAHTMLNSPEMFQGRGGFYLTACVELACIYKGARQRYRDAAFAGVSPLDAQAHCDHPAFRPLCEANNWLYEQMHRRIELTLMRLESQEKADVEGIARRVVRRRQSLEVLHRLHRDHGVRFAVPVVCELTGLKKSTVYNMAHPAPARIRAANVLTHPLLRIPENEFPEYMAAVRQASFIELTHYTRDGRHGKRKAKKCVVRCRNSR